MILSRNLSKKLKTHNYPHRKCTKSELLIQNITKLTKLLYKGKQINLTNGESTWSKCNFNTWKYQEKLAENLNYEYIIEVPVWKK